MCGGEIVDEKWKLSMEGALTSTVGLSRSFFLIHFKIPALTVGQVFDPRSPLEIDCPIQ